MPEQKPLLLEDLRAENQFLAEQGHEFKSKLKGPRPTEAGRAYLFPTI
jgi:hypothetical protein